MKLITNFTRVTVILLTAFAMLSFIMPAGKADAGTSGVDRIDKYSISVSVNEDGSLNMDYRITWTVLSNIEGPLEWVKIGVPNDDVDNVQAISSNIKKAKYYSEDGQDYIRVDFNRQYKAGDTFEFHYSFTQYNMFRQKGADVTYDFTPGWFDEINVTNYMIMWKDENVRSVDPARGASNGYYVWTGSLRAGQKTNVKITYSSDAYDYKAHNVWHWPKLPNASAAFPFVILILGIIVRVKTFGDRYDEGGGYYGGYHHHGGFGGGGGGCACACACACAGGGRAGCSRKDFYGTKLSSARVRARLREGDQKKEC